MYCEIKNNVINYPDFQAIGWKHEYFVQENICRIALTSDEIIKTIDNHVRKQ